MPTDDLRASRYQPTWRARLREHRALVALLVIFLIKGFAIAFIHPPFTGHDEVGHYEYLRIVAEEQRTPRIPDPAIWEEADRLERTDPAAADALRATDDWDRFSAELWRYCDFTTEDWSGCEVKTCPGECYEAEVDGRTYPAGWIYTANHPPLYYVVVAPLYLLTDSWSPEGQVSAVRLATIPFGMLTVLCAYAIMRALAPRDGFLPITTATFIAFQPQLAYEASILNSDILAIALAAVVLYGLALGLRHGFTVRRCVPIGATLGLALLAKSTAATLVAPIAVAMILGIGWRRVREWLGKGALVAGACLLVAGPWFLSVWRTYGDPNMLNRIEALQWWNYREEDAPSILQQLVSPEFIAQRWRELWGGFGWHEVMLDEWLYLVLVVVVVTGFSGYVVAFARRWRAASGSVGDRLREMVHSSNRVLLAGLLTMLSMVVVSYVALLVFGTGFAGTQSRYAFPAITAGAVLLMVGVRELTPPRHRTRTAWGIFAGLVVFTLWIYTQNVIPWVLDLDL